MIARAGSPVARLLRYDDPKPKHPFGLLDFLSVGERRAVRAAARLPLHHRNPWDRLLIAQAQLETITVVTRDRAFGAYDVDVLPFCVRRGR